jgi:hypothetical protein
VSGTDLSTGPIGSKKRLYIELFLVDLRFAVSDTEDRTAAQAEARPDWASADEKRP